MKYLLPIDRRSVALIAHLNGGVRPKIEKQLTYYVFNSRNPSKNTIVDAATAIKLLRRFKISYFLTFPKK